LQLAEFADIMMGRAVHIYSCVVERGLSMASVSDILAGKGRHMITISSQAPVFTAATVMKDNKVGALLVLDEGRLIGMLSERDISQRVVAEQREPANTLVAEVMTGDVICCRPHTDIEEARSVMKNRRVRHLPVVEEGGGVIGMVSIGDLNAYQVDSAERTIYLLKEYIHGTW
jgi:CBS domain-containing protein